MTAPTSRKMGWSQVVKLVEVLQSAGIRSREAQHIINSPQLRMALLLRIQREMHGFKPRSIVEGHRGRCPEDCDLFRYLSSGERLNFKTGVGFFPSHGLMCIPNLEILLVLTAFVGNLSLGSMMDVERRIWGEFMENMCLHHTEHSADHPIFRMVCAVSHNHGGIVQALPHLKEYYEKGGCRSEVAENIIADNTTKLSPPYQHGGNRWPSSLSLVLRDPRSLQLAYRSTGIIQEWDQVEEWKIVAVLLFLASAISLPCSPSPRILQHAMRTIIEKNFYDNQLVYDAFNKANFQFGFFRDSGNS